MLLAVVSTLVHMALSVTPALGQSCCVLPDNGSGSVDLPPNCPPQGYIGDLRLVEGLPPGSTVEMVAHLGDFGASQTAGGSLGGTIETFTAIVSLDIVGTGALAGFTRALSMPVTGEIHSAPRTPNAALQSFAFRVVRLQGTLTDDYDFFLLQFEGGDVFGLSSSGATTLTRQAGVGSDFDVTSAFSFRYRIQFEGYPESLFLDGLRGITLDLQSNYELCADSPSAVSGEPALGTGLSAAPNPMRASTEILLQPESHPKSTVVEIFDLRGRSVRSLTRAGADASRWSWDGRDAFGHRVASGVYFVRATIAGRQHTTRLVKMR